MQLNDISVTLTAHSFRVAAAALVTLVLAGGCASSYELDHFHVYDVSPQSGPTGTLLLQGQFDQKPRKTILTQLMHFANPVRKNREEYYDKHAHLTWYRISTSEPEPNRTVKIKNQFCNQRYVIGKPIYLLCPAEKKEAGSRFPERLSHFKCYEILEAKPMNESVHLEDQWRTTETNVLEAVFFCVPVDKQHGDTHSKITNGIDHLTVYRIQSKEFGREVVVTDQFRKDRPLKVLRPSMLCVPTKKLTVVVHDKKK